MSSELKALLLCAGLGTRLRPLTDKTPKCLMQIKGKPLLEIWIEKLQKSGFKEVLINTHYLSDQIINFLEEKHNNFNIKITTVYEENLLGTGATLMRNKLFFEDSLGLLIHGDNLTNFNLSELIFAHQKRPKYCLLTMLTFNSSNPKHCGIVETDINGVLTNFHEKISNPPSNIANGAIYAFDSNLINYLSSLKTKISDFSKDIIPLLIGRTQTYHTNKLLIDIGTKESLKTANELWGETMNDLSNNSADNFKKDAYTYLDNLKNSFNDSIIEKINLLCKDLYIAWENKKQIYICGNGGSAANAIHLANDLIFGAGACGSGPVINGLKVEALSSNAAVITCIANDINYEEIFSKQLKTKGNAGDLLIALSGSGNSKNILNAINTSKAIGMKSYAILGYDGGLCKKEVDESIHFKINDMQIAEDCQLIVGHIVMQYLNTNKPIK
tara:strand:- start:8094 stop:9422 length:1329 start_codon:yes stop_codon:yes gene_type:complete